MNLKVCSNCKVEKSESDFRVRKDKRIKNPKKRIYLNNVCLTCEAIQQRERNKKQRLTKEGRERHNRWAREFHQRHREKCIAYLRDRRKAPEFKVYMKAYRERNKERIRQQEIITKQRYQEKNRDSLSDEYIIRLLICQGIGDRGTLMKNYDVIEAKRLQLLIKRKINNVNQQHG